MNVVLLSPPMNYLTLENASKSYGEKTLFRNITLHIDRGQKIGLIAKNGTGKSTLLRVIAGLEGAEGEHSKIILRRGLRIGWLDQEPHFPEHLEVLEAVLESDSPAVVAIRRYEKALLHPENADELQAAMEAMDDRKAWDFESKVKETLSKLRLDNFEQKVSTLSGGQAKRLALAKIILEEPDFFVLDEPTNHLDIEMVEWLEGYFSQPNVTLFMVTHDRYFLENVCDSMIELEGGQLHRYKGNYSEYLEKKAMREEVQAATFDRTRKWLRREIEWVRRSPEARTTKSKARVDNFYDVQEANADKRPKQEQMQLMIKETHLGSKIVELHNVSKQYGSKKLLENFSYKFKRKERVGIVGPNGSGKSTFLRLMTLEEKPDTGKVVVGDTILFGHYRQDGLSERELAMRTIDVVRAVADVIPLAQGKFMTAEQLLERFLFTRPQQQVYAAQLSGGERRRLYLCTVLMKNPNFLILDEPTNDLDVITLNILEDFLDEYPGCLVVVTHDRFLLDRLADHLFVFEGEGRIKDYNGTYSEYRTAKKLAGSGPKPVAAPVNAAPAVGLSKPEQNEMKKLENEIAKLEERRAVIYQKLGDGGDADELTKLSTEVGQIQNQLEIKELRWLELAERA